MGCSVCGRTLAKLIEFAPKELVKQRMNICRQCDKLKYGHCSICLCNMFIKTKLKNSTCDLKKW
jgi:hypothetical protein